MKKTILGLMVLSLVFATSCKKSSTSSNNWSFKGTTYPTTTCVGSAAASTLQAISTSPASTLQVYFYSGLPTSTTPATYTVVNGTPNSATQVEIGFGTGTSQYLSTGGNGSNQTVSVSVSSSGKVTVTGSGIELDNAATPSDSSALTLNLTQTQ
jgi:hypothetical protein